MEVISLITSFYQTIDRAEGVLRSGGIFIAPTDTVYGIFGDATDEEAIRKIYAVKQRPEEKLLLVFVRDISMARRFAYISDEKATFLEKIWPGPVTAVFHHKERLPALLAGGESTIGIRIPKHSFWEELLSRLDVPVAQTSANISGAPAAKNIEEVKKYFQNEEQVVCAIDGGETSGAPSAIIDMTGEKPRLVRAGTMTTVEFDLLVKTML